MVRSNQSGSIASFVIISALLVIGSASLLYWVTHRDSAPARTPEVTIPSDTKETEKDSSNRDQDELPGASKPDSSNDNAKEPDQERPVADAAVDQIPQTGPVDTLMQLLSIGILTGVIMIYIRSRHHRRTL